MSGSLPAVLRAVPGLTGFHRMGRMGSSTVPSVKTKVSLSEGK